jgi:peptidoglycan/LPS O-acetylase OafA/YrhL
MVTTVPNKVVVATGYAAYFVVGATAAVMARGDRRATVRALLVAACGLSLVRAVFDARNAQDLYHGISVPVVVAVVAASVIVVLAVAFGHLAQWGRPWMLSIGLLTYPLYLLHDEVSNVLFTHWHGGNRWLLLPLILAVVVALSVAVNVVVEKPLAPRLRSILNRCLPWSGVRAGTGGAPGGPAGEATFPASGGATFPAAGARIPPVGVAAPPPAS